MLIKNITKSRSTNNKIIGSVRVRVRVQKNLFDRVRVQKFLDPTGSSGSPLLEIRNVCPSRSFEWLFPKRKYWVNNRFEIFIWLTYGWITKIICWMNKKFSFFNNWFSIIFIIIIIIIIIKYSIYLTIHN